MSKENVIIINMDSTVAEPFEYRGFWKGSEFDVGNSKKILKDKPIKTVRQYINKEYPNCSHIFLTARTDTIFMQSTTREWLYENGFFDHENIRENLFDSVYLKPLNITLETPEWKAEMVKEFSEYLNIEAIFDDSEKNLKAIYKHKKLIPNCKFYQIVEEKGNYKVKEY